MLTVVTLNLLNDLTFWSERAPLIVQNLRALSPDLIAFQEVALPHNNAVWLAKQLEDYSIYLCPYSNHRGDREGLAILSRLPVERHEIFELGAQSRVAQRLTIHHAGHHWMFVNTHLFWSPVDDPVRMRQVERILAWTPTHVHSIICGDFNSMPYYRAIKLIKHRFISAYEKFHGHEPEYTAPTPLKRGPGLRNSARRAALQALGRIAHQPNPSWRDTVDYIFVNPPIQILDCQITMNPPSPADEEIYPSDHLGLMAKLDLPAAESNQ
jgi:endonuclease/exonuclease/phosphatase family metal-dependent hydrolase